VGNQEASVGGMTAGIAVRSGAAVTIGGRDGRMIGGGAEMIDAKAGVTGGSGSRKGGGGAVMATGADRGSAKRLRRRTGLRQRSCR